MSVANWSLLCIGIFILRFSDEISVAIISVAKSVSTLHCYFYSTSLATEISVANISVGKSVATSDGYVGR